jgi:HNH endonuclease
MEWSEKARKLVKAAAEAPNRALSRLEMARTIGSENVNATNSVLGHFGKALALTLDPALEAEWKPDGQRRGDWVMFICERGLRSTNPTPGEGDDWVFVIHESLARALNTIGFARYQEISDDAFDAMWPDSDEDEEDDGGTDGPSADPLDDINAAIDAGDFEDVSETERDTIISARVGQGAYREGLLERWDGRCAVTGTSVAEALVASHIKPWADSSNVERLDVSNGLLLVGTLDRLFDNYLISFDAGGAIMISPTIPQSEWALLHINSDLRLSSLTPETAAYLEYHRTEYFRVDDESEDDEA